MRKSGVVLLCLIVVLTGVVCLRAWWLQTWTVGDLETAIKMTEMIEVMVEKDIEINRLSQLLLLSDRDCEVFLADTLNKLKREEQELKTTRSQAERLLWSFRAKWVLAKFIEFFWVA